MASSTLSSPLSNIERLPDELLLRVFDLIYIESTTSKKDSDRYRCGSRTLLSLALCSRRLYAVTLPAVYRYMHELPKSQDNLVKFLRQILAVPALGHQVKLFHGVARFTERRQSQSAIRLHTSSLPPDDWIRVESAATEAVFANSSYPWVLNSIENGYWPDVAALVLSRLPNLEELELSNWIYSDESSKALLILNKMASISNSSDQPLSNLRRISINSSQPDHDVPMHRLLQFFMFPSLSVFETDACCMQFNGDDDWMEKGYQFPAMKELQLLRSVSEPSRLSNFLQLFPNLERLTYGHTWGLLAFSNLIAPNSCQPLLI
ncbi:hypothetical protein GLAREA_12461 [Glarea lozoyensis ATCC 20868]|uniref:F-box domain-containing protein n=1 Tax=Glarea lozoyensis (strain ATCC 20868 / MF5171) TaxID=1116229 RepID=S3D1L1_GLAL2|nr:uncharacterized protein GLAREA_12461 [Glarea lozoyensis ATCC 20868]EPE31705.1 hypothetical protein GLAREA_12461 [Glarea lozoyensis ATCC 20868]